MTDVLMLGASLISFAVLVVGWMVLPASPAIETPAEVSKAAPAANAA